MAKVDRDRQTEILTQLPMSPLALWTPSFAKHFTYDELRDLQLRIYKPKTIAVAASSNVHNLPIIIYVHGGGFCNSSRVWPNCHNSCPRLTSGSGVVVVAPDFGLSPEHRVPVIFDNVIRTVRWIGGRGRDEWLSEGGGGDPRHHLAVRLGYGSLNLDLVRIKGYMLILPFFGAVARTGSEKNSAKPWLNLEFLDWCWKLALPDGATRDDPWDNPFGPSSPDLEAMALDRILVIAGGTEMMKDRIDHHVKRLAKMGKVVEYRVFEGQRHDFFLNNSCSKTGGEVAQAIMRFIYATSA
ncbi:hypothetical protein EUGRSUZ_A02537 [Eucalyptus grandis]|uniref:Uncharacterized protein n=1 Tax=Eucalyptus grandis TaxID=71139 RepID=A0ACC3M6E3_EUCGR|nr:hypothetical protein EUGRSUZ_A02537 [Eucalyptus grandis]